MPIAVLACITSLACGTSGTADGAGTSVASNDLVGTWSVRETVASTTCAGVDPLQQTTEGFTIEVDGENLVVRTEDASFEGALVGDTATLRQSGGGAVLTLTFTGSSLSGRGEIPGSGCTVRTTYAGDKTSTTVPEMPPKPARPTAPLPTPDTRADATIADFAGVWNITEVVADDCETQLYEQQYTLEVVTDPSPSVVIGGRTDPATLDAGRLTWRSSYAKQTDIMQTNVWVALIGDGTLTGKNEWKLLNDGNAADACSGDATLTGRRTEGE